MRGFALCVGSSLTASGARSPLRGYGTEKYQVSRKPRTETQRNFLSEQYMADPRVSHFEAAVNMRKDSRQQVHATAGLVAHPKSDQVVVQQALL
jgi:hypothetical protein